MKPKIIYMNKWLRDLASEEIKAFGEESSIEEAEAIVGMGMKVNKEFLDKYPKLKVVALTSVGYDTCDVEEMTKRGVYLTNTADILTETTADLAFALIMATGRRIVEGMDYIREGKWTGSLSEDLFSTDVHGKKLGIIGFGRIGQAIARRGKLGFGMDISYYSRHEARGFGFEAKWKKMDEVLAECDYVCVAAPLTKETKGMIGEREFGLMKKSGIFINIARGPVIDEAALIKALQDKVIRAAGLDVFEKEPLSIDSPLLKMKQVVITPHIGSASRETRSEMIKLAIRNARMVIEGQVPVTLVNTDLAKK